MNNHASEGELALSHQDLVVAWRNVELMNLECGTEEFEMKILSLHFMIVSLCPRCDVKDPSTKRPGPNTIGSSSSPSLYQPTAVADSSSLRDLPYLRRFRAMSSQTFIPQCSSLSTSPF